MSAYDVNGNIVATNSSGAVSKDTRSILHQGWHTSTIAGNSKSAFVEAFNRGFTFVEADLNVTSDGYLVMSHDSTASITYADWKTSSERMSFDEFLMLIKKTNLNVYLDGKAGAQSYLQSIYDKIMGFDLLKNFTMIGTVKGIYSLDANTKFAYDPGNLGMDLSAYTESDIIYTNYTNVTAEEAQNAIDNGFTLELYTLSTVGNFINCFNNIPMATRWCTDNISVDAVLSDNL